MERVAPGEPRFFGLRVSPHWLTGAVAEHRRQRLLPCPPRLATYAARLIARHSPDLPKAPKLNPWFNPMGASGPLPVLRRSTVSGDWLRDWLGMKVNFHSAAPGHRFRHLKSLLHGVPARQRKSLVSCAFRGGDPLGMKVNLPSVAVVLLLQRPHDGAPRRCGARLSGAAGTMGFS